MYLPFVKAFNYALDRLSGFDVPGLPEFQEKRQIVFARSSTRCIKSESYLQGSYKLDIILVKWDTFKRAHECNDAIYSKSYKSNICSESDCDQPSLSWRNILSTLSTVALETLATVGRSHPRVRRSKTSSSRRIPEILENLGGILKR
jgi:hypothetical protein